ncbi:hypothetical protein Tco_0475361 [Tanacetum coccineum]
MTNKPSASTTLKAISNVHAGCSCVGSIADVGFADVGFTDAGFEHIHRSDSAGAICFLMLLARRFADAGGTSAC